MTDSEAMQLIALLETYLDEYQKEESALTITVADVIDDLSESL